MDEGKSDVMKRKERKKKGVRSTGASKPSGTKATGWYSGSYIRKGIVGQIFLGPNVERFAVVKFCS
jgi:hypothetical protein